MPTRYFALVAGIAYIAVGLLGFIPGAAPHNDMPPLAVDAGSGYLLGLFPINVLHNIVHLAIGAWGIASYASYSASRAYGRGLAIIYALFAVMGLIPGLNTTFGLVPLFGADVVLHILTAMAAAYFGFVAPADTRTTATSGRI